MLLRPRQNSSHRDIDPLGLPAPQCQTFQASDPRLAKEHAPGELKRCAAIFRRRRRRMKAEG